MGRGRDKAIKSSDFPNMSPAEQSAVNNLLKYRNARPQGKGILPRVRVRGTAVVRSHEDGKVRYGDGATPGAYKEDKI